MSKNIWDDEPFRDGAPEFTGGEWKEPETYTPAPESALKNFKMLSSVVQKDDRDETFDVEEFVEQVSEEEEDDFTEVLSDARLRLEQGKLYEMIMNHDLFGGVDADPRAAKSVQKQIRKFAKEQMEIMLGMRQEVAAVTNVVSDFSALQTQALKDIANKLITSKGMKEEDYPEEQAEQTPVAPPKKKTLNTIGPKPQMKPQPKPQPKPIAKKAEPIQRAARPQTQQERPPKELTGKSLHEMTEQEKADHIRGVNERNKAREQVIPANRAPWPSFEEQMGIAHAQVSRAAGGNSGISALNGSLSRLVMNSVKKS